MVSSPTVAYVADQLRVHQLLVSIASWVRFASHPVAVVDIGLTSEGRTRIERLTDGRMIFLAPVEIPPQKPSSQRTVAFEQKTLLGGRVPGDPIVFLDTDILVAHPSFLTNLAQVPPNTLRASRSAWDADFTWTYTAESLRELCRATNQPDLHLTDPIVNSGVWAMRAATAARVVAGWNRGFRAAVDSPDLSHTLRPRTGIGDQEFLLPACRACGVAWDPLHGSFNMQVHERRMPWLPDRSGRPRGGHIGEPAEPIRAVHYGCEPDGTVRLEPEMIASETLRRWIAAEYATCHELATRGRGC
jgi:hypothetical protein